ncbi:hypothetical protein [Archangium sp.]|uniref:hypothetical protein n=1 Tax=Archangium sp. TaxID=1872627 RepID=UPI00286A3903|nr:hypothetical protein [Archangium sp.]
MSALVCALTLTLLGAAPAQPQMSTEGRMLFEAAPPQLDARVGEWVTYQMDGVRQGFMRMAVVSEQKDAQNRDAVWLEVEFGLHPAMKAPMGQFLMLVARETGIRPEGISRLFVTQGFEKLQEVDKDAMPYFLSESGKEKPSETTRPGAAPSAAQTAAGKDTVVKRGKPARLMTLAGTVTAEPMEVIYRGNLVLKRYWMSREIPLLRLAKIEFPSVRYTMEVRDYGVDARPRMVLPAPGDKKMTLEPASNLPAWMQPDPDAAPEPEADSQEDRP